MNPQKAIINLYSGGMDSYLMHRRAVHDEIPHINLNFDIGQGYRYKEQAATYALQVPVVTRKVEWLNGATGIDKQGATTKGIYIPGRNLAFVTLAACMFSHTAAHLSIWLGALKGELHAGATDKNLEFAEAAEDTLSYVLSPFNESVSVDFPFADLSKLELAQKALTDGWCTPEQLAATSSCMSAEPGCCGECIVCLRRWGIFRQLGISHLEQYVTDPLTAPDNIAALKEMMHGSYYDQHRIAEVLPALTADERQRIEDAP